MPSSLTELNIGWNKFRAADMTFILREWGFPASLAKLDLGGNDFDGETLEALISLEFPLLEDLGLSSIKYFEREGVRTLAAWNLPSIKTLGFWEEVAWENNIKEGELPSYFVFYSTPRRF